MLFNVLRIFKFADTNVVKCINNLYHSCSCTISLPLCNDWDLQYSPGIHRLRVVVWQLSEGLSERWSGPEMLGLSDCLCYVS